MTEQEIENKYRLKMFLISEDRILSVLTGKAIVDPSQFPEDAEFICVGHSFEHRGFLLRVRSDSFDIAREAHALPIERCRLVVPSGPEVKE